MAVFRVEKTKDFTIMCNHHLRNTELSLKAKGLLSLIEIYFNFIGEYIPPTMAKKEPTPEELEEMRKKEARKDKLYQNYLKRKANGKQKEYEERTKAKKKEQIESQKEQIRAEDREKGIYFHAGVPNIPRAGKQAVM